MFRKFLVVPTILLSLLSSGCTMQNAPSSGASPPEAGIIQEFILDESTHPGDVCISEASLYYTDEQSKSQAQFPYNTDVIRYNLATGTHETVLSLDFASYGYIQDL